VGEATNTFSKSKFQQRGKYAEIHSNNECMQLKLFIGNAIIAPRLLLIWQKAGEKKM
jgi:hypothetical protein